MIVIDVSRKKKRYRSGLYNINVERKDLDNNPLFFRITHQINKIIFDKKDHKSNSVISDGRFDIITDKNTSKYGKRIPFKFKDDESNPVTYFEVIFSKFNQKVPLVFGLGRRKGNSTYYKYRDLFNMDKEPKTKGQIYDLDSLGQEFYKDILNSNLIYELDRVIKLLAFNIERKDQQNHYQLSKIKTKPELDNKKIFYEYKFTPDLGYNDRNLLLLENSKLLEFRCLGSEKPCFTNNPNSIPLQYVSVYYETESKEDNQILMIKVQRRDRKEPSYFTRSSETDTYWVPVSIGNKKDEKEEHKGKGDGEDRSKDDEEIRDMLVRIQRRMKHSIKIRMEQKTSYDDPFNDSDHKKKKEYINRIRIDVSNTTSTGTFGYTCYQHDLNKFNYNDRIPQEGHAEILLYIGDYRIYTYDETGKVEYPIFYNNKIPTAQVYFYNGSKSHITLLDISKGGYFSDGWVPVMFKYNQDTFVPKCSDDYLYKWVKGGPGNVTVGVWPSKESLAKLADDFAKSCNPNYLNIGSCSSGGTDRCESYEEQTDDDMDVIAEQEQTNVEHKAPDVLHNHTNSMTDENELTTEGLKKGTEQIPKKPESKAKLNGEEVIGMQNLGPSSVQKKPQIEEKRTSEIPSEKNHEVWSKDERFILSNDRKHVGLHFRTGKGEYAVLSENHGNDGHYSGQTKVGESDFKDHKGPLEISLVTQHEGQEYKTMAQVTDQTTSHSVSNSSMDTFRGDEGSYSYEQANQGFSLSSYGHGGSLYHGSGSPFEESRSQRFKRSLIPGPPIAGSLPKTPGNGIGGSETIGGGIWSWLPYVMGGLVTAVVGSAFPLIAYGRRRSIRNMTPIF